MESDWSGCYYNGPPVEFDTSANHRELKSSAAKPEGNSHLHCNTWTDEEPARVQSCSGHSFAMDARMRLDHLKSGYKPALDRPLGDFHCQKDALDTEAKEEESALDLVELLDVEDDVEDEESWLYECPKKRVSAGNSEPALRWCRRVLDNPSPEVEEARRALMGRLDRRLNGPVYRCPVVARDTGSSTVDASRDKMSNADILDSNKTSISSDFINTNYKLHDITDVHVVARLQEASLRQDYVSTPSAASRSGSDSPVALQSAETLDDVTAGSKTEASPSSCWQLRLSSLISSPQQSLASRGCQSPKLARLHQQVTQFKMLKLAQNQGTSACRTRSPLRTSLRSLQAVRNSRSLETDDWHPTDHQDCSLSGASPTNEGSRCCSPSLSAASLSLLHSMRDSSVRTAAIKRLHRSQSLSPCRIPHPAKGHLSLHGRVFSSSERPAIVAWATNTPTTQRSCQHSVATSRPQQLA